MNPRLGRTRAVRMIWVVAALGGLASGCAAGREIRADEDLIFFPTQGCVSADGEALNAAIHAWVFERETESLWRRKATALVYQQLEVTPDPTQKVGFEQIARMFLVDNERGKEVVITLAGSQHRLGPSDASGHIRATVTIDRTDLDQLTTKRVNGDGWLDFKASVSDGRELAGRLQRLTPEGLTVISDVDDTIKESNVRDKKELLANTFLRPFRAIDGMAEAYQRWRTELGAAFGYVSASPWQLYPALEELRETAGFPAGVWLMKSFRLKDSTFFTLFADPERYKIETIEEIINRFPQRRFVLVGDSGEKDPEAYGELSRRHARVEHVFIRNVTSEGEDNDRYRQAFRDLPREKWTVFEAPARLHDWRPAGSPAPEPR